jgi:hypothetical protein
MKRPLTEEEIRTAEGQDENQPLRAAQGCIAAILFMFLIIGATIIIMFTIHYFNKIHNERNIPEQVSPAYYSQDKRA